ncbi:MAG TPA: hypothetical protein PL131_07200 [Methylotenera sp.]|nr:hypothetical protein [Methylotenera sp.]HPH05646.1 hypothetical protein [Methylotenera sp.]HPN01326.1 hypothetical protein [Methylotenera sp.]
MGYREFLGASSTQFRVNDHVIVCGDTTWQIQNIAATSIGKREIPFKVPEPRLSAESPKFSLSFLTIIFVAAATWAGVHYGLNEPMFAMLAAALVVAALAFRDVQHYQKAQKLHRLETATVSKHLKVWQEIKNDPPILYSLMLETNAGSKPLFYSFDDTQIIKARDAINRSMEKKDTSDINFEIETVNIVNEGAINNFALSYYNHAVKQA